MPVEKWMLGQHLYLPQPQSVLTSWKQCWWTLKQIQTEQDYSQFCPRRTQTLESNQPRLCCLLEVVFPRRQFPSSLSSFELAFQIVATDACDSINNRPIYSALIVSVFWQWRRSSIRKQPYISPFQHMVVLFSLAFLGSTLSSTQPASFLYYCALESIRQSVVS